MMKIVLKKKKIECEYDSAGDNKENKDTFYEKNAKIIIYGITRHSMLTRILKKQTVILQRNFFFILLEQRQ